MTRATPGDRRDLATVLSRSARCGPDDGPVLCLRGASASQESLKVLNVDPKKCRSDAESLECSVGDPALNGALVHLQVICDLLNCYVTRRHFSLHS